ncbi:uncharacterized protein [Populus alba]|uniref:uncharacterized protein isoform X2 n=1 Tax=Populus alba TaxID=43335 RepID=UPI003CC6F7DD
MSPRLTNLEEMTIDRADNLKQIFYGGEGDALPRDGIIKFPRLRELSLQFRSNYIFLVLTNFAAQLPLQQLTIQGHEEVGNWLAQLQMVVHGQQNGFLQRLEIVRVVDYGDVRTPFPAKLLRALKNLKGVTVDNCKSLEEVFELGELPDEGRSEEKKLLSSLTELQLQRLPELKCIWKGPTGHVSLQNLVHLRVWLLDKLTFIFTPSLARSLPKLERLYISKCGELKHIIKEEDGEREIIQESPCFPKLKTIIIEECGKLEYVFPVSVSPSLLNLEKMQISDADNLKQIFYSGEGDALTTDFIIKFPRLSELDLSSISNYSIFGPKNFTAQLPSLQYLQIDGHSEFGNLFAQLQQNDFLQRLEIVRVKDCGDVRAPFPAKLLQALKNPWRVEIEDCKSLEEVFELGELPDEGRSEEKELLSSLTELRLQRLLELKCIWKGPTRHLSLQSLAHLKLDYLDKLTFIFTQSLAHSLPKLERLEISKCGELKHIIREEDGEREIIRKSPGFPKLKSIIIKECGKLEYVFPVSVSPSLLNLEKMQISVADNLKQIFYSGEGDALTTDGIIKFPRLSELNLRFRSNYIILGPKNFAAQLPLQQLTIQGHEEVGNWLAQLQQNGFLQRLEIVLVYGCGDARTPFPAKLLRALKNLKMVTVSSCKSLEEVFELGEENELLSSLTQLWLQRLPELKCIWKGPTRHLSLQSLAHLKLDYLDKLTFIFTQSLAHSLPKLERLEISKCGELKHIIREEDGEREIIRESPGFPKLKSIIIKECGKLEYVFPVSGSLTLQSIPQLETLEIRDCHELKHIIREEDAERKIIPESPGQDDQASPINVEKEIVLPNLKKLSLEQLSSIVCFSFKWCDYFLFPRLEKLKVHQCPKLTTKFTTTPDGSMSAQSKVSEVAEDSSINREWTRDYGLEEEEDGDDW